MSGVHNIDQRGFVSIPRGLHGKQIFDLEIQVRIEKSQVGAAGLPTAKEIGAAFDAAWDHFVSGLEKK